jgi:hypothetical protein
MLEIVSAVSDLNILTIEELRVAVGLDADDTSQDDRLETLGLRVAAMITSACQVAKGGLVPPTLLQEGCVETFRLTSTSQWLFLARRPIFQMVSVTEGSSTLQQDVDYEVDPASGQLTRLSGDHTSTWACGKVVVEYDAGYDPVPDDLKAIAAQLAGGYWADDGVDPMEKKLEIPNLISTERWVDSDADAQMPKEIFQALLNGGYVNRNMVL